MLYCFWIVVGICGGRTIASILCFASLLGLVSYPGNPVQAQVSPDTSLGPEGSVIDSLGNQDLITGGAVRGGNLFHSFQEFNVAEGRSLFFANPVDITRIFSRVTGRNPSTINGTLGVLGNADLFLLNPNGILFGPNSQLAIAGSFLATTGDRFTFADGTRFSARALHAQRSFPDSTAF